MIIKGLVDEDFVNYKVPSMFIITSFCTFKCDKESGIQCCQNSNLVKQENRNVNNNQIVKRFMSNPITKAIVFGGLEPLDQFSDVLDIIRILRKQSDKDVVIYTGYTESESAKKIETLKQFKNIIVKFGRFIPDSEKRYDEVLGINLSSNNQYAKRIS